MGVGPDEAVRNGMVRDDLVGNAMRTRIMEIVTENPGLNIQEIAAETELSRTAVVYHVRHLIRDGTIVTRRQGHHKLHFTATMPAYDQVALTVLRVPSIRLIIESIFFQPGITRKELEERLHMTGRTTRRALHRLRHEHLVHEEVGTGHKAHHFQLDPKLRSMLGRNRDMLGEGLPVLDEPRGLKAWFLLLPQTWRTFLSPW